MSKVRKGIVVLVTAAVCAVIPVAAASKAPTQASTSTSIVKSPNPVPAFMGSTWQ
jgi:hypothetical protein